MLALMASSSLDHRTRSGLDAQAAAAERCLPVCATGLTAGMQRHAEHCPLAEPARSKAVQAQLGLLDSLCVTNVELGSRQIATLASMAPFFSATLTRLLVAGAAAVHFCLINRMKRQSFKTRTGMQALRSVTTGSRGCFKLLVKAKRAN